MYIGVDQSLTSTGVAIISPDGGLQKLYRIPTGERRGATRLIYIQEMLEESLSTYEVLAAAQEGFSVHSQNRPFDLGEVSGIVRVALFHATGTEPWIIPPKMLKKFVANNGSATKVQVQKAIATKWDVQISQDDMADAYGLARLAMAVHTKNSKRREELEVVHKLLNPDPLKNLKSRTTPATKTPNI